VTAWVIAHRTGWLTSALQVLTWLGSTAVIIPAGLAIGLYFLRRRRTWRPLALLAAAVAGAIGLYHIVKPLVGRPRPPAAIWIGRYTGASFPSGHATQSAAFYAMLAIVLGAGLSIRRRAVVWGAAALVVAVVGASRIYLGAHWLTDVLAGYALGASWVAIVVAVLLITSPGTSSARPVRQRGQAPTPGHQNRQKPDGPAPSRLKRALPPTGPASSTTARTAPRPGIAAPMTGQTVPRVTAHPADQRRIELLTCAYLARSPAARRCRPATTWPPRTAFPAAPPNQESPRPACLARVPSRRSPMRQRAISAHQVLLPHL
jgi:undecaprenyl-diphosphatase